MTVASYTGGAPILGERLALDLLNTSYAVRGKPVDGIRSADDATAWVAVVADRLRSEGADDAAAARVRDDEFERMRALRDAARGIATQLVGGPPASATEVDLLNALAATAPRWASLSSTPDGELVKSVHAASTPVDQVLSALAHDAIDLFTGPDAAALRRCDAPGCVLFFLKNHPRREWCTPACGARVRAARAYGKRTRAGGRATVDAS